MAKVDDLRLGANPHQPVNDGVTLKFEPLLSLLFRFKMCHRNKYREIIARRDYAEDLAHTIRRARPDHILRTCKGRRIELEG